MRSAPDGTLMLSRFSPVYDLAAVAAASVLISSPMVLIARSILPLRYSKWTKRSSQLWEDASTDQLLAPLFLQLERHKTGYQAWLLRFAQNGRRRGRGGRESSPSMGIIHLDQEGACARPRRGRLKWVDARNTEYCVICWCRRSKLAARSVETKRHSRSTSPTLEQDQHTRPVCTSSHGDIGYPGCGVVYDPRKQGLFKGKRRNRVYIYCTYHCTLVEPRRTWVP